MPLSGVIFDFDGVLVNTEPIHLKAYQEVMADTPLTLETDAYYARYLGYDDVGVFTAVATDQGVSLSPEELNRLLEVKGKRFQTLLGSNDILFPGAAVCIEQLAIKVPLGIASGALHHEINEILSHAGLRRYFSVVVAADDIDQPKPAPDSYLRAAKQLRATLGINADGCFVAIEDSRWGIESAHEAGLACIAVTNTYPATDLALADATVSGLSEVDFTLLEHVCRRCKAV